MKIRNRNEKIPLSGFNSVMIHGDEEKAWLSGVVTLPEGFVNVYGHGGWAWPKSKHTVLEFILNGRKYVRVFDGKFYSKRGVVTKAKQFVADVVGAT